MCEERRGWVLNSEKVVSGNAGMLALSNNIVIGEGVGGDANKENAVSATSHVNSQEKEHVIGTRCEATRPGVEMVEPQCVP